ncbi:NAD(P)H-dependent FMN reductase [Halovenus aranensis]|uniref:NAD(P)H-dependent FMN reductase n=1 Tax=Halovenus aranensis TaxID=890420 RepID=A0A1G8TNB3_9EURY|nr:NAD(P)H-dependent oxidoreductase [Halovenus aranensis]SDJ42893.1 NAD(P)H-dependent FMN reductase [Halovenus aranensis]
MSTQPHVVALCGSLRDESHTRTALGHALDGARDRGASTELLDLREYDLPVFDPDDSDAGDAERLREAVRGASAVILGTPMYHGSYAAPLKNAIDYCGFDEFEETTVGLLAVAGGSFPTGALDSLRTVCRALDAWTLPHQVAIPSAYDQFEDGEFVDDSLESRTRVLGQRVVEYARIEPNPPSFESEQNAGGD